MGRIRRSRHEREEVGIITNEWVEMNCARITKRDMEILKLLARFPVMSSRHIRTLTPFREISRGQQRCNDRIRILYDLHCVNKQSPLLPPGQGTSVQYVWLDRAGAKLLGIENFRRRKSLPQDYLHSAGILDVHCAITEMEHEGELEIKYHAIEQRHPSWPLIPDLLYILRMEKKGYICIVEVDRCEKKEKDEIEKIESYRDWQLSNQWLQEEWANIMPVPRFPRIIYAFDESKPKWKGRATRLRRAAERCGLKFTTCSISDIDQTIRALSK
jgi:hypothetical protein